jgi:hypothetical protein
MYLKFVQKNKDMKCFTITQNGSIETVIRLATQNSKDGTYPVLRIGNKMLKHTIIPVCLKKGRSEQDKKEVIHLDESQTKKGGLKFVESTVDEEKDSDKALIIVFVKRPVNEGVYSGINPEYSQWVKKAAKHLKIKIKDIDPLKLYEYHKNVEPEPDQMLKANIICKHTNGDMSHYLIKAEEGEKFCIFTNASKNPEKVFYLYNEMKLKKI